MEIPSLKSSNISTAGFLSRDNRFTSWVVQGAINTEMMVKIFEEFAQSITKKTVVILDNASSHTSKVFQDQLPGWRQKGLPRHSSGQAPSIHSRSLPRVKLY